MNGYNSNRMSLGSTRRSQKKQLKEGTDGRLQEGRKHQEGRKQIKTDNTRKEWKQSRSAAYYADMKKQNDSLRKLPKSDKHHIPTFPKTDKGRADHKKFYTFSPENQKLRDLRKLGIKMRKKHGY